MRFSGLIGLAEMTCLQVNSRTTDVTVPEWNTGLMIPYVDQFWGGGELLYAQAGFALDAWSLCSYLTSEETFLDTELNLTRRRMVVRVNQASTAMNGNGVAICIPLQDMTQFEYGWFVITSCNVPGRSTALHTSGANLYSDAVTAGRWTTTFGALRQIVNSVNVETGGITSQTQILECQPGKNWIKVKRNYRSFLSEFVSATGIPGGAQIIGFESDTNTIYLSAAVTSNGAGSIVTFSRNNGTIFYPYLAINRPCMRGPAF